MSLTISSRCVQDLQVVKLLYSSWLSEMVLLKFLVKKNEGSHTLQLPSVSLCASTLTGQPNRQI